MFRTKFVAFGLSIVYVSAAAVRAASAQQATASGIAGVVRDTSGAVLPGVTVEAASPALIEKVRSVVTDSEGRYNIVDLRPGTYSVTFTLPSFSTFKREGIELPSGFTATVNAEMKIGALEETVTVTGAAPLVDTQNVRKQTLVSSDLLNVLPSSVKNLNNLVSLTPGFRGNEGFDVTGGYTGTGGRLVPRQRRAPTSRSTAWGSARARGARATTRTRRPCRKRCSRRAGSPPTPTQTAS